MDARGSMLEKDAESKLKAKSRERLQPKMGRLDLDYNVMRDAFLRYVIERISLYLQTRVYSSYIVKASN